MELWSVRYEQRESDVYSFSLFAVEGKGEDRRREFQEEIAKLVSSRKEVNGSVDEAEIMLRTTWTWMWRRNTQTHIYIIIIHCTVHSG